jgi:hypothetical protein
MVDVIGEGPKNGVGLERSGEPLVKAFEGHGDGPNAALRVVACAPGVLFLPIADFFELAKSSFAHGIDCVLSAYEVFEFLLATAEGAECFRIVESQAALLDELRWIDGIAAEFSGIEREFDGMHGLGGWVEQEVRYVSQALLMLEDGFMPGECELPVSMAFAKGVTGRWDVRVMLGGRWEPDTGFGVFKDGGGLGVTVDGVEVLGFWGGLTD